MDANEGYNVTLDEFNDFICFTNISNPRSNANYLSTVCTLLPSLR